MLWRITGRKQHRRPVADATRPAASRQSATAASSAAGLNGFCRLEIAPSLVAMVRKSGAGVRIRSDRPAGDDDDRNLRPLLANQPHGFESVHSRHEDIEKQQIEISGLDIMPGPLRPSPAVTTLWPARSSNRRTVAWTAASSSTTRIFAKVKSSPGSAGIRSTAGCEFCRIALLPQLLPRQERAGRRVKKPDKKTLLSACCRADKYASARAARVIVAQAAQRRSRKDQLLRYSGYRARIRASSLSVPDRWVRRCFCASSGSPASIAFTISL